MSTDRFCPSICRKTSRTEDFIFLSLPLFSRTYLHIYNIDTTHI